VPISVTSRLPFWHALAAALKQVRAVLPALRISVLAFSPCVTAFPQLALGSVVAVVRGVGDAVGPPWAVLMPEAAHPAAVTLVPAMMIAGTTHAAVGCALLTGTRSFARRTIATWTASRARRFPSLVCVAKRAVQTGLTASDSPRGTGFSGVSHCQVFSMTVFALFLTGFSVI